MLGRAEEIPSTYFTSGGGYRGFRISAIIIIVCLVAQVV